MREPVYVRHGVPFYYNKSESETKADPYERYDEYVVRQSILHYGHQEYPLQKWLDYLDSIDLSQASHIVDVGCSVGRVISHIAQNNPRTTCFGLDYSYQMIRRAQELHTSGKEIELKDWSTGLSKNTIHGRSVPNLKFGLARAEDLPYANQSVDLVISSFLIDRLTDPLSFIKEAYRSLKTHGHFVLLSPLNYNSSSNWDRYYPLTKLLNTITDQGFQIVGIKEKMTINEPIDLSGNQICWNCVLIHLTKSP